MSDGIVGAAVPCQDLERAKGWYKEKLGLSPTEENPGGAYYQCGEGSMFFVYPSAGQSDGSFTQVGFMVGDIEAEMAELREAGVTFEEYDFPGLKTVDGIAEIEGSKGSWFKDCEGNLLAVFERTD